MSKQIDMENPDGWSDEDKLYLQNRGMLPADMEQELIPGVQVGNAPLPPNVGHAGLVRVDEDALKMKGAFDDYKSMTPDELKTELRERGLPATGTKGELVFRLLEDDQRPAVEDDEEIEAE